jgi:ring-1,2-phenylacetyl-CoA epoxidase subunit PaaD
VTVREIVGAVRDPELRVVTIGELGVLRDVTESGGHVTVTITPTYSGCPAMDVIRQDIVAVLQDAGFDDVEVRTVLAAPWTTDWITDEGRAKLAAAGIVPPARRPVPIVLTVRCPLCGSPETEQLSRFGSTACKSLWRCRSCQEPFEMLKTL